MRSKEEVQTVLGLVDQGLNDCEIERRTGIPRETIRDWRCGQIPRQRRRTLLHGACPRCGHEVHDFEQLPAADYAYLLGLYLGDGCISAAQGGVFHLRIVLDRKYPEIIDECAHAMGSVMPTNRVGKLEHLHQRSTEVSSWSRSWPCLFPQHGPGKKHHRRIWLALWQLAIAEIHAKPLLRGLIHSDGCRFNNTIHHPKKTYVYPTYQFSNRSADIKRIFCDACDALAIDWRFMGAHGVTIARREAVARMDEFIGPKR